MAPSTRTRSRFRSPEPITARPEERIAARTEARRSARPDRAPRSRLGVAILVVTLIGLADATYLTYVHYYGLGALACFGGGPGHPSSCATVQSSEWSKLAGIPVAVLGLAGYLTILVSLRLPGELGRILGFGTALVGFLFSAYLTYREAFSIHQYCEWCLGSAACLTVLTVLLGIRYVRTPPGTP